MHIAYITTEFITEKAHGGLATYIYNIAKIMREQGHEVTIFTLSDREGKINYENLHVVRVKRINIRSADMGDIIARLLNSWTIYIALKREKLKRQIDIVQMANYQAIGFFRDFSIPTVVRVSSDSALCRNAEKIEFNYDYALEEKTLEDYLELWCVKCADFAFAPSRFCARVVSNRARTKISVIESPYPNLTCEMDDSIYQERLLHKKYILFNSSLSRLKGTHIGIEATGKLLEKYPDLHIVYTGNDYGLSQKNGGVQSVAEIVRRQNRKYNGRVMYLGSISKEKLFPLIRNAFACILPSRVDNLPNSCIEVMSLGGIVIGTYGASFEQLITNKENGLLIQRDSSKALIKALDYLMSLQRSEYLKIGIRAMKTIERLSPQRVYTEMINMYNNVINTCKR